MTVLEFAGLWAGLIVSVPAYYLADSLVDLGDMTALQGVAAMTFANLVIIVTLVLTAAPAATHRLPILVLARAAFGVHDSTARMSRASRPSSVCSPAASGSSSSPG
jgi:NCS1 family nucleobase:cation symporter-1